jgi:undecaprenyl-diphosphatase
MLVRFTQSLTVPGFHDVNLILTRVGHTPWALPLTALTVGGLWLLGHPRLGLFLAFITVGRLAGGLVKVLIDRTRPDASQVDLAYVFGGPSFPSGHVLGTTLLLGWICYSAIYVIPHRALRLAVQAVCVAGMVMMGLSRIELGAHWPTDVLGGYLIAGLLLIPLISLDRSLHHRASAPDRHHTLL